jgi:hypothetical protein
MIIATAPSFIKQGFITNSYAVRDTSLTSPTYFDITYFPEFIGGGKSLIKLKGNGINLLRNKLSEVEILDSQGNPVYYEIPTHIDRFENYFISIHVYDSTAPGMGSVSIVGVATENLQGQSLDINKTNDLGHNIIWTRPIKILPFERNNSEIIFDDPPQVFVSQVIAPAKVSFQENLTTQFSAVTGSQFTIRTSNFKGFDKKLASSLKLKANKLKQTTKDKIVDSKIKQISANVDSVPFTVNNVNTTTRTRNPDIIGGFILNETNRYNTVLISSQSFFSSSYLGATVAFYDPTFHTISQSLLPQTSSNYLLSNTNPYDEFETSTSQSLSTQLERWKATIVDIKDDKIAYLDQPVQVDLKSNLGTVSRGSYVTHTYQNVNYFTASILYSPETLLYTTSSEVSQSYLQFTMQDVRPIGGDIYKIRIYYRRGSETGDWEMLQDQVVSPVEFLTDARYPNQTAYAADLSDYFLLGYFTDYTVLEHNWSIFNDLITTFDTSTASLDSSVLMNGVKLTASASINKILTTRYYQNYPDQKVFSLTFNCTLDPYTELEIYQNSETLQTTVFNSDPFPRAFDKTSNYELARYADRYNRFGKLIGKIQNNTNSRKNYQRVVFDFKTDSEGLGRPLFRVKQYDTAVTASAYISSVNLTPRQLSGFTPSTIEFAFPAKLDTNLFLNETIDYKLEYYDYTGNQSEYITYLENIVMELTTEIPTNACQSEAAVFRFNPLKYYLCDYTKLIGEATQSVLINYPSESLFYNITNNTTGSLADLPEELRLWPDWDLEAPSAYDDLSDFFDRVFKGWQNLILGTPNLAATVQADGILALFNRGNFWNVLRPSMSIVDGSPSSPTTTYIPQYRVSASYDPDGPGGFPDGGNIFLPAPYIPDLAYGTITSSWFYIDRFTIDYVPGVFNQPTPPGGSTYEKNVYRRAYTSNSINTIDQRIFHQDGGLGISQLSVSNSYYSFSIATTDSERTEALKKRRLYWPATASAHATANYFTQNGGIYNVKFKLKRNNTSNCTPDPGSYMNVFLYDVRSNFTTSSSGIPGWYPPPQNIVKIGNQYSVGGVTTPAISFIDSATGYLYDEYNINLIQYGTPAQLVFEPAGVDDNWFGIVIDDVEFCKIGVTTDPYYIRPQIVNNTRVINNLPNSGNNLPPAISSEK